MFSKKLYMAASTLLLFIFIVLGDTQHVKAQVLYENSSTGYEVIIDDSSDLLTDKEENLISEQMKTITAYGGVALITSDEDPFFSALDYSKNLYREYFGTGSGTLLLIDMDKRRLQIYSDGDIYQIIDEDYADIITDNIYTYATDEDYYTCVMKAFEQIDSLLSGQKIAQPMKYISNILMALIFALLINFFITKCVSHAHKPSDAEQLAAIISTYSATDSQAIFTHETKRVRQSNSSSSGGGGGGGGGGSSSGGGGGHSF